MSNWVCFSRQRRLHRKAVPDGSNDFQRVLDEILLGGEGEDKNDHKENNYNGEEEFDYTDGERYRYEDDFEHDDDTDEGKEERPSIRGLNSSAFRVETNNNGDNNNNNESCYTCSSVLDECQGIRTDKLDDIRDVISPSGVVVLDLFSNSLSYIDPEDSEGHRGVKLPQISQHNSNMGTSCSSSFYDRRDWHNVAGGNTTDLNKPGKRGRLLKKRSQEDDRAEGHSPVPSGGCTCQQHQENGGSEDTSAISSPASKGPSEKRSALSPNDIKETSGMRLTSNRLSPNVDSSGHMKVSRVVGSGRARATASCDVSPHRLLTRRNNSPSGRTGSLDAHLAGGSHDAIRQRSYSWSNGKIGNKTSYKSPSLSNRSVLSPVGNRRSTSPQIISNGPKTSVNIKVSKPPSASATSSPQCPVKLTTVQVHDPNCPLHGKTDSTTKVSASKALSVLLGDNDEDLAPMTRRRAASESQTTRPRRLLPRTPDSLDQGHSPDHAHVHWADEEKGCSLSTCVFLSSIRPRSYSHGAMDNAPHRPILKKVTGF